MRPVNLIPSDARRADGSKMRTGVVPFVLLAALGLALLGVVAVAFTSKSVSDKTADVERLNQELEAATAEAQSLAAFAEFGAVEEMRAGTVASLAQSRFDWERVLNELALVLPENVWLVEMAGTVSPAVQVGEGAEVQIRDTINGPALEIIGCATGQDAVAGFVADLEDIDGVTRVGVASSELPETPPAGAGTESSASSGSDEGGTECRTRDFISRFEIAVAFDEVPVPATATAAPSIPAPLATGEVDAAQSQQTANSSEVAQSAGEVEQATNVLPGG